MEKPISLTRFGKEHTSLIPENGMVYISARSGAGKSHLTTWLCSLPGIRNKFHAAIVVSPTSNLGQYKQFEFIAPEYHHLPADLPAVLEKIKATSSRLREKHGVESRILLIMDDCLTDSRSMGQTSRALASFVSVRRHYGCEMWLISQRIQACSPTIRNQCSMFITFSPRTMDDRRFVIKNFLTRELVNNSTRETLARADRIMDTAFAASPYAALAIDCVGQSPKMLENCYLMIAPPKLAKFKLRLRKPRSRRHLRSRKHPSRRRAKKEGDRVNKEPIDDELLLQVHTEAERGSGDDDDDGTPWRLDLG